MTTERVIDVLNLNITGVYRETIDQYTDIPLKEFFRARSVPMSVFTMVAAGVGSRGDGEQFKEIIHGCALSKRLPFNRSGDFLYANVEPNGELLIFIIHTESVPTIKDEALSVFANEVERSLQGIDASKLDHQYTDVSVIVASHVLLKNSSPSC